MRIHVFPMVELSSILQKNLCACRKLHSIYCAAAMSPPELRLQGERTLAALGEAVSKGSTPLNSVIALGAEVSVPCVATRITASPFCNSGSLTSGIRANICWRSPPPLGRVPPALPAGGAQLPPLGDAPAPVFDCVLPPAGVLPGAPSGLTPFSRMAIRCATKGGTFRIWESDVI